MGPLIFEKGDKVRVINDGHDFSGKMGTLRHEIGDCYNVGWDSGGGAYVSKERLEHADDEHIDKDGVTTYPNAEHRAESSCSICGGSGTVKDDRNKDLSCGACSFEIAGSDGYWNSNLYNAKVEPNYRGPCPKESYHVEAADGSVSLRGGLPEEHRMAAHEAKRASGVAKMAKVPSICSGQYKYSMFNKPADLPDMIGEVGSRHMTATQAQIANDHARLRMDRYLKASGSVEDPALAGRRLCDLHSAYLFDQLTQNGQEVKELKVFASDGSRIPS